MMRFIKLIHSVETLELIRENANAFVLLSIIAIRANRNNGEALIGDFNNYDMTERAYRTAKKCLTKRGIVTVKTTNKGTIATIADSSIYDINMIESDGQNAGQVTGQRQASDRPEASNKNKKIEQEVKKESKPSSPAASKPNVWKWWIEVNRELGRKDPLNIGRDMRAGREIGAAIPDEATCKEIMRRFLTDTDPFLTKLGHALHILPTRINTYKKAQLAIPLDSPYKKLSGDAK